MFLSIVQAASGGDISPGFDMGQGWFDLTNVFGTFDNIISIIIAVMTVIAGLYFIFIIITGGMSIISSSGNKTALEDGRKKIFNGLIGLVIVIAAVFLVDLIGAILGFNILGAGNILSNLTP